MIRSYNQKTDGRVVYFVQGNSATAEVWVMKDDHNNGCVVDHSEHQLHDFDQLPSNIQCDYYDRCYTDASPLSFDIIKPLFRNMDADGFCPDADEEKIFEYLEKRLAEIGN